MMADDFVQPAAAGSPGLLPQVLRKVSDFRVALAPRVHPGNPISAASVLEERESTVTARRNKKVLPPGGRNEALYPVVVGVDLELRLQVLGGRIGTHRPEKLSAWDERRELELWLLGPVRDVQVVESWAVHADMDRRAVPGTR
jgi:hypothetical protein